MRYSSLFTLIFLLSCVRSPNSAALPSYDDESIVFPDFHGSASIIVGESGKAYELDGVVLRALMVAASDLIPFTDETKPCSETLEALGFQVVRQGDLIFVSVHADLARCGHPFLSLDSGVKYAINKEGRILRRVRDGESGTPADSAASDAGPGKLFQEPGLSTVLKSPGFDTERHLPPGWKDGGSGLDAGGEFDGGRQ
ncbi:hypothetical protein [Hyalangium versicolor]|uniref:hypothetical protein n=1 Tax=Hyalangium versicolor TaxID=2861190 RepID=UPI001CCEDFE6|nr:hypothetical protein [Hyalangium versicolor]